MKLNLDLGNVESTGGGGDTLLPEGSYAARVVDTALIETANGHALKVIFNVITGDHEGAQFSDFLNIINKSEQAQRIAQGKLKKIMEVGGHANPGALADSQELHGLIVTAKLVQEPNYKDANYTDNKVKGYSVVATVSGPPVKQSVGAMKTITNAVENIKSVFPNATLESSKGKLPWE